jgi:DNA-binding LytR/AlgR family response regulator
MNNMEERLDPDKFVRVHRSYLVNISYIKEIQPWSTVTMLS